jgi:group I intron endonuclease
MESIGIYKITSPTNRIYIGQSINIERRIKGYKNLINCKGQPKLYKSFIKHGTLNHIYEIIELCEIEMLNERERFWQEKFNSINGLNCNYVSTFDKKQLPSIEVRLKMSLAGKGKKQSEEHIIKRVNSKKGYNHTKETKNKIALKHSKILLDLNTGIFYDSILIASEIYNINKVTLQAMLTGRFKNKTNLIFA